MNDVYSNPKNKDIDTNIEDAHYRFNNLKRIAITISNLMDLKESLIFLQFLFTAYGDGRYYYDTSSDSQVRIDQDKNMILSIDEFIGNSGEKILIDLNLKREEEGIREVLVFLNEICNITEEQEKIQRWFGEYYQKNIILRLEGCTLDEYIVEKIKKESLEEYLKEKLKLESLYKYIVERLKWGSIDEYKKEKMEYKSKDKLEEYILEKLKPLNLEEYKVEKLKPLSLEEYIVERLSQINIDKYKKEKLEYKSKDELEEYILEKLKRVSKTNLDKSKVEKMKQESKTMVENILLNTLIELKNEDKSLNIIEEDLDSKEVKKRAKQIKYLEKLNSNEGNIKEEDELDENRNLNLIIESFMREIFLNGLVDKGDIIVQLEGFDSAIRQFLDNINHGGSLSLYQKEKAYINRELKKLLDGKFNDKLTLGIYVELLLRVKQLATNTRAWYGVRDARKLLNYMNKNSIYYIQTSQYESRIMKEIYDYFGKMDTSGDNTDFESIKTSMKKRLDDSFEEAMKIRESSLEDIGLDLYDEENYGN